MKNASPSASDLSAKIADALRQEIISGVLLSNDRLPSEADLCEKFDVPSMRAKERRAVGEHEACRVSETALFGVS